LYLSSRDKGKEKASRSSYMACMWLQVPKSVGRPVGYIYVAICTYTHMHISCKEIEENHYDSVLSTSLAGVDVWKG
jgi:hypothetical protein